MTDKKIDLKSKKPVDAALAKALRENGIAQGLYTARHFEEWKLAQEEGGEDS